MKLGNEERSVGKTYVSLLPKQAFLRKALTRLNSRFDVESAARYSFVIKS